MTPNISLDLGINIPSRFAPKPKPTKTIRDLPDDWMITLTARMTALGSLLWDYTDTVLDITISQRRTATKPLCRAVRQLQRDYDQLRQRVHATSEIRKQEEEWGLDFEDFVKPHTDAFLQEVQAEDAEAFGNIAPDTRWLLLAVEQAVLISDALRHYTDGCDRALTRLGVDMEGKTVCPLPFRQLARLLPEFAGDLWRDKSPARAKAAEALAKELLKIQVHDLSTDSDLAEMTQQ